MGPFVANGCQFSSSSTCDNLLSTASSQIGVIDQVEASVIVVDVFVDFPRLRS
jgi:hypothetical protein